MNYQTKRIIIDKSFQLNIEGKVDLSWKYLTESEGNFIFQRTNPFICIALFCIYIHHHRQQQIE